MYKSLLLFVEGSSLQGHVVFTRRTNAILREEQAHRFKTTVIPHDSPHDHRLSQTDSRQPHSSQGSGTVVNRRFQVVEAERCSKMLHVYFPWQVRTFSKFHFEIFSKLETRSLAVLDAAFQHAVRPRRFIGDRGEQVLWLGCR